MVMHIVLLKVWNGMQELSENEMERDGEKMIE
jgi:hypothetical protein